MSGYPGFGVWPNVHGTMVALGDPDDPVDAAWSRVRDQVLLAERLGIETFMLACQPFEAELQRLAGEIIPRVQTLLRRAEVAS